MKTIFELDMIVGGEAEECSVVLAEHDEAGHPVIHPIPVLPAHAEEAIALDLEI